MKFDLYSITLDNIFDLMMNKYSNEIMVKLMEISNFNYTTEFFRRILDENNFLMQNNKIIKDISEENPFIECLNNVNSFNLIKRALKTLRTGNYKNNVLNKFIDALKLHKHLLSGKVYTKWNNLLSSLNY